MLDQENKSLYVNITVDLLFDERVNPTTKLWTHKNRRSVRSSQDLSDRAGYKHPEYRLNEDPVIIMNHRSNMFDLIEQNESSTSKPNSVRTSSLMQFISHVQEFASGFWRIISDEPYPQEKTPKWHPSKLDKIVDFESVQRAMSQESSDN